MSLIPALSAIASKNGRIRAIGVGGHQGYGVGTRHRIRMRRRCLRGSAVVTKIPTVIRGVRARVCIYGGCHTKVAFLYCRQNTAGIESSNNNAARLFLCPSLVHQN